MTFHKISATVMALLFVAGVGASAFAESAKTEAKTVLHKTGEGIKTGAEKVGQGIKTGAKKVEVGTKKGAHKVKETFDKDHPDKTHQTTTHTTIEKK